MSNSDTQQLVVATAMMLGFVPQPNLRIDSSQLYGDEGALPNGGTYHDDIEFRSADVGWVEQQRYPTVVVATAMMLGFVPQPNLRIDSSQLYGDDGALPNGWGHATTILNFAPQT